MAMEAEGFSNPHTIKSSLQDLCLNRKTINDAFGGFFLQEAVCIPKLSQVFVRAISPYTV